MNQYYTLNPWEAIDLLTQVMIKYCSDKKLENQIAILSLERNFNYLMELCSYTTSDLVAVEISNANKTDSKQKAGKGQYTKLIYEIAQDVQKGHPVILNYKSLNALIRYIDNDKKLDEYVSTKRFDPDYAFRDKFISSKWEIYFWDYIYNDKGQKEEGITIGYIQFKDYSTVLAHTYKPRERNQIFYTGNYERYKGDHLKIRLRATNSNTQTEEDVSILLYIGDSNVSLSLGQYRDIENGALTSGSVVINRVEDDFSVVPLFITKESNEYKNLDPNISKYLASKELNYLKTPKKVTSLYDLIDWFNKHPSRRTR